MPLLQTSEARAKGAAVARTKTTTAVVALKRFVESQDIGRSYDIFLSHAFKDAELILGVREFLVERGFSVYVDWLDDPELDRSKVTPATADRLRARMRTCKAMLFAVSENSPLSKWMPWELGYFDGYKPKMVAIFPLSDNHKTTFVGQEYLGLYPYIELNTMQGDEHKRTYLWVEEQNSTKYVKFDSWLTSGRQPYQH